MTPSSSRHILCLKGYFMLHKKKGFTLIEILVVMLVSTLVLTMVGGTMVFITTRTGELIHNSEEINTAQNIEKYLRYLAQGTDDINCLDINNDSSIIAWNEQNGDINHNGKTVFENTGITFFNVWLEDDFLKCKMKFQSGREFEFIVIYVEEN